MMKILILGIVLIAAVVFGFWFWGELDYNQDELSNFPVESDDSSAKTSGNGTAEDSSAMESELNSLDLNSLDEDLDSSGL